MIQVMVTGSRLPWSAPGAKALFQGFEDCVKVDVFGEVKDKVRDDCG